MSMLDLLKGRDLFNCRLYKYISMGMGGAEYGVNHNYMVYSEVKNYLQKICDFRGKAVLIK